jgi:8-oxo-dGTP pyrophosphatase MutT (NUDIX family)
MVFEYVLGIKDINKHRFNVNSRTAVRAVIVKDEKILMVHCNKGDYKFPGGGMHREESHEEALIREVEEETGYIISKVEDKIGVVLERNFDKFRKNCIFEMASYYYLCEVSDKTTFQRLDDYEERLGFRPVWIDVYDVISQNEKLLKIEKENANPWVYRETLVLNALKEYLYR